MLRQHFYLYEEYEPNHVLYLPLLSWSLLVVKQSEGGKAEVSQVTESMSRYKNGL